MCVCVGGPVVGYDGEEGTDMKGNKMKRKKVKEWVNVCVCMYKYNLTQII